MTKAELIQSLASLPDDAEILVDAVAVTNRMDELVRQTQTERNVDPTHYGMLATLHDVSHVDADGPGAPAFAILHHTCNFS